MGARARGVGLVVGTLLATACKGASVPPPARPSDASVTNMFKDSHKAAGPAYAHHSNRSGQDYVFVFEARTHPAPDCGMVDDIERGMPDIDKGGWVSFTFKERLKVGKNPIFDAGYISGDKSTQSLSTGSGAIDGVMLDVTKADGKTIEGTITTDGKNPASGNILAVVCP